MNPKRLPSYHPIHPKSRTPMVMQSLFIFSFYTMSVMNGNRVLLRVSPYRSIFSSLALMATMTVLRDMRTAPAAGLRRIPSL